MYTMLAICLALHPICIDETVYSHLREKYGDRMIKMQKGSVTQFYSKTSFCWNIDFLMFLKGFLESFAIFCAEYSTHNIFNGCLCLKFSFLAFLLEIDPC